ncbi:nucleoid-associated protein [Ancylomarina salipaludis]|uniref:Nucleoid-associated protein n=1 Tax=Ancylomarina salipaludis TaxID=2501299 RepID=A0A4Q1JK78_9BACT|nr:nucleoid-associated protein [Ancylomarina salipaludis]RXQ92148.1 nucleoid-associated protein [Ancylomarina salipaludis]
MTNVDYTEVEIRNLITHQIGNKLRDEKISLSKEETSTDFETKKLLLKYFLIPLKSDDVYCFTHPVNLEMNDLFLVISNLFENQNTFLTSSHDIGRLLYEESMHPKIKEGKLNIVYFSNVFLDDEVVDAIGIYKSEKDIPFIRMKAGHSKFDISHEYGFDLKGIDKGCIVFNSSKEKGYKILLTDNSNKTVEAQYWKDDFLKVTSISNEYNQTNNFLGLTKQFLTKQLTDDVDISKSEQIDLLNRSVEYFKTNESFIKEDFEETVLGNNDIIESFRNFDEGYREKHDIQLSDNFNISPKAVKKQARAFKRVLKLDENFDIYIKGNKELIEKGIDENGRKYYKIYYNEEK